MTAREIVITWLKENGFDGLAGEYCGCGVDDLMPCNEDGSSCAPARKVQCKDSNFKYCDGCEAFCQDSEKETAHIYIKADIEPTKEEETHL